MRVPKKKKGKGKANQEDMDDGQGADEHEEEAQREPKPKPKPKSKKAPAKRKAEAERKAPVKRTARARVVVPTNGDSSDDDQNDDDPIDHNAYESEGEVGQEPKDKDTTAKGNAASKPNTRANRNATTRKSYSYGFEEDIETLDDWNSYKYGKDNEGSQDEYIPSTKRGKKGVTKGNGMAKGKATKTVDPSGYDQSTGEFDEEVEPQGTRKSSGIAKATSVPKQGESTIRGFISEDRNRVKVIFKSNGIDNKSDDQMVCTEDNQSADRVVRDKSEVDESKSLFVSQDSNDADTGLIDPRDIKQEKVTPDPENPFGQPMQVDLDDADFTLPHN